jgi:prepilin-type processing-associated H-X9-DG protein
MTGRDPETLLRDALLDETRDIATDPTFVNAAVDHSVAKLRRTRARNVAVAGAAAAAVVALVAWQAPQLADRADPAPTAPHDTVGSDAMAWAWSLPRGSDANVAYVDGHTLVAGTQRTILVDGGDYTVLGVLPGGWFAARSTAGGGPYVNPRTYGYLDEAGHFHAYDDPRSGRIDVEGAAVSPDGGSVVFNGVITRSGFDDQGRFDPSTAGSVLEALPGNARVVEAFSDGGVVYRDKNDHFWGQAPRLTRPAWTRESFDDYAPDGYGVVHDGDCVRVGAVSPGGNQWRLCGRGDPVTVSSANYALMSDGEFLNLEQGVDFRTLPADVDPEQLQTWWETNDSLILVTHQTEGLATSAVLVRCVVSAGLCERASDQLSSYPQLAAMPDSSR